MEINEQNRIEIYRQSPTKIRELYTSSRPGEIITKLGNTFAMNFSEKLAIEIIGDCILGFYKTTDLPRLFQEKLLVGADQAHRMTAEFIEFLTPVIEREQALNNASKAEVKQLADDFSTKTEREVVTNESDDITPVTPLRTMQGDIDRIHGYGAYRTQNPLSASPDNDEPIIQARPQEDLLNRNPKPVADMPKYDEDIISSEEDSSPAKTTNEIPPSTKIPIRPVSEE